MFVHLLLFVCLRYTAEGFVAGQALFMHHGCLKILRESDGLFRVDTSSPESGLVQDADTSTF